MKPFDLVVDGDLLSFSVDADLPPVCFRCGTRERILRRTKKYSSKAAVVFGAEAAVTPSQTQHATISMPLCMPCDSRHRRTLVLMSVAWLVVPAMMCGAWRTDTTGDHALAGALGITSFALILLNGAVHWFYARKRMAPGLVKILRGRITLGRFDGETLVALRAASAARTGP